jgi:hypothetical protein
MEQQSVKIIGLKINEQMGILQSCELQFDPNNNLIAFKGGVGAGKTTIQKALMLGTQGSETLKDDKQLYGTIDEEVQLIDGAHKIFIGCKSNAKGGLDYVLYTKDVNGKKIKDPVIDGVKQTPATYLKNLQTELTWRMDELMSENQTVQRKILLELYRSELAGLGVVYDKKSPLYSDSILGRIEAAEQHRSHCDFLRKQVGGFQNQLDELGIDLNNPLTIPTRTDIKHLEAKRNKLQYDIDNFAQTKQSNLQAIKNQADSIILEIKQFNSEVEKQNSKILADYNTSKSVFDSNIDKLFNLMQNVDALTADGNYTLEDASHIKVALKEKFINVEPTKPAVNKLIQFDENGKAITKPEEIEDIRAVDMLNRLHIKKIEYAALLNSPQESTEALEKELKEVVDEIILANEINKRCDMVDAYENWHAANAKVIELKNEYASLLKQINTGVDGLLIHVDKEDSDLSIYLTYNGSYDVDYFANPNKEERKLSSYSGTQKPLICLLLQNYLLSKKPKAMRYLFIDNVPIDKKTKNLLNRMGDELGVVIIVNITGDFTKETLSAGEILIEGGEIFFSDGTNI